MLRENNAPDDVAARTKASRLGDEKEGFVILVDYDIHKPPTKTPDEQKGTNVDKECHMIYIAQITAQQRQHFLFLLSRQEKHEQVR